MKTRIVHHNGPVWYDKLICGSFLSLYEKLFLLRGIDEGAINLTDRCFNCNVVVKTCIAKYYSETSLLFTI